MSRNLAFQHSCLYVLCLYLVEIILVFLTFNNKFPSGTTSEVIFATAVPYLTQFNWVQYSWKGKAISGARLLLYILQCCLCCFSHSLLSVFFFLFFFNLWRTVSAAQLAQSTPVPARITPLMQ